jgi:branched-chain amino acid transport system permease protein
VLPSSSRCRTTSPPIGAWVTIIQGVIFVIAVLLFREGIIGVIAKRIRRPL